MRVHRMRLCLRVLAVAALTLAASTGCTSLGRRAHGPFHFIGLYISDRFQDFTEVADIGFTFSTKSKFAFYESMGSLLPFGVSYVDGYFLGFGGGQFLGLGAGDFLVTRYYFAAGGMGVWGYEEIGWQSFDTDDLSTIRCQDVGPAAIILPPYGRPGPIPSFRLCVHGWLFGAVTNVHLFETLDFLLGFVGLDICGDDGVIVGKWWWQTEEDAEIDAFEFYDYHRGFADY